MYFSKCLCSSFFDYIYQMRSLSLFLSFCLLLCGRSSIYAQLIENVPTAQFGTKVKSLDYIGNDKFIVLLEQQMMPYDGLRLSNRSLALMNTSGGISHAVFDNNNASPIDVIASQNGGFMACGNDTIWQGDYFEFRMWIALLDTELNIVKRHYFDYQLLERTELRQTLELADGSYAVLATSKQNPLLGNHEQLWYFNDTLGFIDSTGGYPDPTGFLFPVFTTYKHIYAIANLGNKVYGITNLKELAWLGPNGTTIDSVLLQPSDSLLTLRSFNGNLLVLTNTELLVYDSTLTLLHQANHNLAGFNLELATTANQVAVRRGNEVAIFNETLQLVKHTPLSANCYSPTAIEIYRADTIMVGGQLMEDLGAFPAVKNYTFDGASLMRNSNIALEGVNIQIDSVKPASGNYLVYVRCFLDIKNTGSDTLQSANVFSAPLPPNCFPFEGCKSGRMNFSFSNLNLAPGEVTTVIKPAGWYQYDNGAFSLTFYASIPNKTFSSCTVDSFSTQYSITTSLIQHQNVSFRIHPNPTTDAFTVTLPVEPLQATYKLYNTTGKEVKMGPLPDRNTSITTSELSSGMYILHLMDGKKVLGRSKVMVK